MSQFADKLRELRERATRGPWRESSDGVGAIEDSSENTLYYDEGTATTENNQLICFMVNHAAEIEALVRMADIYAHTTPCSDPDCCAAAIRHEAARLETLHALSELNKESGND